MLKNTLILSLALTVAASFTATASNETAVNTAPDYSPAIADHHKEGKGKKDKKHAEKMKKMKAKWQAACKAKGKKEDGAMKECMQEMHKKWKEKKKEGMMHKEKAEKHKEKGEKMKSRMEKMKKDKKAKKEKDDKDDKDDEDDDS